jgi:hypothetical protein
VLSSHDDAFSAAALLHSEGAAFMLCRPPGHHAGGIFAGRYCYGHYVSPSGAGSCVAAVCRDVSVISPHQAACCSTRLTNSGGQLDRTGAARASLTPCVFSVFAPPQQQAICSVLPPSNRLLDPDLSARTVAYTDAAGKRRDTGYCPGQIHRPEQPRQMRQRGDDGHFVSRSGLP